MGAAHAQRFLTNSGSCVWSLPMHSIAELSGATYSATVDKRQNEAFASAGFRVVCGGRRVSQILFKTTICLSDLSESNSAWRGCPVPWPRRAASRAMLRVAAGGITLFTLRAARGGFGALVSVALTTGCPAPACAGHPALRCLDFPLRPKPQRPSFLPLKTGGVAPPVTEV